MWGLYEEFNNGLDELAKEDWISFRYYLVVKNLTKRLLSRHDPHLSYGPQGNQGQSCRQTSLVFVLFRFHEGWVIGR